MQRLAKTSRARHTKRILIENNKAPHINVGAFPLILKRLLIELVSLTTYFDRLT